MKLRSAPIDFVHQEALVECSESPFLTWLLNAIYFLHHQALLFLIRFSI